MKIMGPEGETQDKKLPVEDIKQHQRIAADFNKWSGKEQHQQHISNNCSCSGQPAPRFEGVD